MKKRGDFIQTISGAIFYPLDPKWYDMCIHDIAYALSMKPRYNGHVRDFLHYSVAEHCVLLAENILRFSIGRLPLEMYSRWEKLNLQLWALLHDAAEAYLPDVPRPIKRERYMKGFCKVEENIMNVVAEHYALYPDKEPLIVKQADTAILADEKEQCMAVQKPWNVMDLIEEPLGVKIEFLSPKEAYNDFTEMFWRLKSEIRKDKMNEF